MFLEDYGVRKTINKLDACHYLHGKLHNENGPAVRYIRSGVRFYYLYGALFTREAWEREVKAMKARERVT
jgi:hypothetical protein